MNPDPKATSVGLEGKLASEEWLRKRYQEHFDTAISQRDRLAGEVERLKARAIADEAIFVTHEAGMDALRTRLATAEKDAQDRARLTKLWSDCKDCAEYGWTIIANAGGGDWNKESKDWQEAAVRFRTQYYACLDAARPSAATEGKE